MNDFILSKWLHFLIVLLHLSDLDKKEMVKSPLHSDWIYVSAQHEYESHFKEKSWATDLEDKGTQTVSQLYHMSTFSTYCLSIHFKSFFCLLGKNLVLPDPANHNLFIKSCYLIISVNRRCVLVNRAWGQRRDPPELVSSSSGLRRGRRASKIWAVSECGHRLRIHNVRSRVDRACVTRDAKQNNPSQCQTWSQGSPLAHE